MGGVAGHLAHLYDNRNLTYNKMAEILQKAANGELIGTEKTDGYNIYLGFVDGRARAARNKGDMQKGGMTMEDLVNREFRGGEKSKKAYVTAFQAYEKAISTLSEEEKAQIFGPRGEIFYNTEIQGPVAPNVVNYDENILNIHHMGHKKYNHENNSLEIVDNLQQGKYLDQVIDRFEQAAADEPFSVRRTAFLDLNRITDEEMVNGVLDRIQSTGYTGDMTLGDFLESKILPMITEALPELDENQKHFLANRILGKKGAPTTPQITKGMPKEVKARVSDYNKNSKFLLKELIEPIEMAIHDLSVELLRGLKSAYILDNAHEVKRLKKETEDAIRAIKDYEGPEQAGAQDILVKQLAKLKHHENIDTVVEGFVFQHDGQLYKFTGNFAPMNQLLGLFRYGRGKIPQMVKEAILEQNEADYSKEMVAILPGKFKPAHRGHLDMIRHYLEHADRVVVLISPKEKDGITADVSERLLQMYVRDAGIDNVNIEVSDYPSPVQAAMEYGNNPELEGTQIILGASSKGGDAVERFGRDVQKYVDNAEILNPLDYAFDPVGEVISATDFRNALRNNEDIDKFIPAGSKDKAEIIADMVKEKLQEDTQPFLGIFRGLVEEVLQEVYSDKQRRWACAQAGESREDFKGKPSLTKGEAEEMCSAEMIDESPIEDFRQNAKHKEVSALAANLRSAYDMHKELKAAYDKAPDKHASKEDFYTEKALTDEIIVPYFKEVEQMEKRSDEIDDPSELRNFLKNDFRKTIEKHPIVMKQLYSTAKQKGVALSKSILQIVLQKSAQELRHAQGNFKRARKVPVETFVPRAIAEKEDLKELSGASAVNITHLEEKVKEKIYFPAKHLKSTKGEYNTELEWKNFATLSDGEKREWAETINLEEPIDVTVYVDGIFGFDDGHHRVMAARLLNKDVPIEIGQRQLVVKYPEAWEKWKEAIIDGERDPKKANPEGYLLKNVDSIEQLLQSEELEEISAMGSGAVAGYAGSVGEPRRRKRKLDEKEVNEALNYLLQKLGV